MSVLDQFVTADFAAVTTFRGDSEPVTTTMWPIVHNDQLWFLTPARSGKVLRLKQNPSIEVAICSAQGTRYGVPISGTAILHPYAECAWLLTHLQLRYGWSAKLMFIGLKMRRVGALVGIQVAINGTHLQPKSQDGH